jgi:hypothetical protein
MNRPDYRITFADALTKKSWGTAAWQKAPTELSREHHLTALRNEVTGVQVQITSADAFVLVLDKTNWLHPLGFTPRLRLEITYEGLPGDAVEVFPIGYIEGDDRRLWMETLDRRGYAEVPAGRLQAVYIRVRVPAVVEPGSYTGVVRALAQAGFEDETLLWEGSLHLDVVQAALPEVKDYAFQLNLWQHLTSIARFHHVPLWSDDHFALIDRYYASLAQLGQKVVSIVATEIPWSGQKCFRDPGYPSYLFEHAVVGVSRSKDGGLRFDFGVLDKLLDLAGRHYIDQKIDLFGLINIWVDEEYGFGKVAPDAPDAVRVRCYDEATGTFTYLRAAADLQEFIRALHDHLEGLGVLERVRVAADEPANLEAFNRSLAFVRQAGPGFQYSAAINHFEFLEEAPEEVKDFIPVLPLACRDPQLTARLALKLQKRGGKMHWYVCCWPPVPNTFLHSPLVEGRLHGWLSYALGLDGFLRWAFCLWPADPWQRVSWRAPGWPAGDMYFVLPGLDGAPVETLRYEALRMAAQDFELIKLVERRLPDGIAQETIQRALKCILRANSLSDFANVGTVPADTLYSLDPKDYHAARKVLLDALANA